MESKKPEFLGGKKKIREYWRELYSSTREKISRGASHINKMISRAKGENWRRRKEKKK